MTERHRVAHCGRGCLPDPEGGRRQPEVRVLEAPGGERVAHFAGVFCCGWVWGCPVCGPKVRQKRALELDAAAVKWLDRYGMGSALLLTLTVPHETGQPLAEVLGAVRAGYGRLMAGRAWQDDKRRYGLAHYVRAHDMTLGANGWHPHIHAVLFTRRPLRLEELEQLERRLAGRWADAVEQVYGRRPSLEHGVQLEQARSLKDVNNYVCQVVVGSADDYTAPVAYEVARGDLKTGRRAGQLTPWEVLELTRYPETRDEATDRWLEFERATRGVHAIQWSKGLRAELELEPEATDEALAAEEVGGETVYQFTDFEWYRLTRGPAGAMARVLDAAEDGGGAGVRAYLEQLGIARPPPLACSG